MKALVIILALVGVGLATALVMRSQRSDAQLELAHTETTAISNQLSEVQLKLDHQDRMNVVLKNQVQEREATIAHFSNDVAQVRTALATHRAGQSTAQAEVEAATERGRGLAAQRDGLSSRVAELNAALREQERDLREARERAFIAQTNLAAMTHQLATVQTERDRLEAQLADPKVLEAQLDALERQQAARKKPKPAGKPDYRLPLELQPDGSVVLTPPPATNPPEN